MQKQDFETNFDVCDTVKIDAGFFLSNRFTDKNLQRISKLYESQK